MGFVLLLSCSAAATLFRAALRPIYCGGGGLWVKPRRDGDRWMEPQGLPHPLLLMLVSVAEVTISR